MDTIQHMISIIEKEMANNITFLQRAVDTRNKNNATEALVTREASISIAFRHSVNDEAYTTEQITDVSCGNTAALVETWHSDYSWNAHNTADTKYSVYHVAKVAVTSKDRRNNIRHWSIYRERNRFAFAWTRRIATLRAASKKFYTRSWTRWRTCRTRWRIGKSTHNQQKHLVEMIRMTENGDDWEREQRFQSSMGVSFLSCTWAWCTTTNTSARHTRRHDSNDTNKHATRIVALPQSHPGLCGTPVGPGKDTHGTPVPDRERRGWPNATSTKTTTAKRQPDTDQSQDKRAFKKQVQTRTWKLTLFETNQKNWITEMRRIRRRIKLNEKTVDFFFFGELRTKNRTYKNIKQEIVNQLR